MLINWNSISRKFHGGCVISGEPAAAATLNTLTGANFLTALQLLCYHLVLVGTDFLSETFAYIDRYLDLLTGPTLTLLARTSFLFPT